MLFVFKAWPCLLQAGLRSLVARLKALGDFISFMLLGLGRFFDNWYRYRFVCYIVLEALLVFVLLRFQAGFWIYGVCRILALWHMQDLGFRFETDMLAGYAGF